MTRRALTLQMILEQRAKRIVPAKVEKAVVENLGQMIEIKLKEKV